MRICPYPGCGVSLADRARSAVWCRDHAEVIRTSSRHRRVARKDRAPMQNYTHCVSRNRALNGEPRRKPCICCKHCFGQPWTRLPERLNERRGGGSAQIDSPVAYPPGLGVPGWHVPVCKGCGLAYEPQEKLEHGSLVRSSAGTAADLGGIYGLP